MAREVIYHTLDVLIMAMEMHSSWTAQPRKPSIRQRMRVPGVGPSIRLTRGTREKKPRLMKSMDPTLPQNNQSRI